MFLGLSNDLSEGELWLEKGEARKKELGIGKNISLWILYNVHVHFIWGKRVKGNMKDTHTYSKQI